MGNSECDFNNLRVMRFVLSIRDALQTKTVIKKHAHRGNDDCAVGALLMHRQRIQQVACPGTGASFGALFVIGLPGDQCVSRI